MQQQQSQSMVAVMLERCEQGSPRPNRSLRLTVLTPVYNERHVVEASLRRVLALEHPLVRRLQLVVVDDCSTDGSYEILQKLAARDPRIVLLRHQRNQGKGAAIRTGIARAEGDVTIIHDADLEYHPLDIPSMLVPFVEEGADAVFGSRYLSAPYRRALMHRHTVINRVLTSASNWITDLSITDLETCYKAVRTTILKSIPLRSDDFRFEVELVCKLVKRRASIFETPIRYMPRSYAEGKKVRPRDGVKALLAMLHYGLLVDDHYQEDEYGTRALIEMDRVRSFRLWLGDVMRPYVGDRVLELCAGVGSITNQFIPRNLYVAGETNPHHLDYLRAYALGKPYLKVLPLDPARAEDFEGLAGTFDTVVMAGVLERARDPDRVLRNARAALAPGGRLLLVTAQGPELFGTVDQALGHVGRYTRRGLCELLERQGLAIEHLQDVGRFARPGWWLNGRVLGRQRFSRAHLKLIQTLTPVWRRLEGVLPWPGLNLFAVARAGDPAREDAGCAS